MAIQKNKYHNSPFERGVGLARRTRLWQARVCNQSNIIYFFDYYSQLKFHTTVWRIILIVIFSGLIIPGLSQKPDNYDEQLKLMYKNTVPLITPEELAKKLEVDKELVLLDAREINEYKVSHLKGARYIGYNNFNKKTVKDIPKDASIVVYCSLGVRSEKVGEQLLAEGYSNVKNLYGGIFEWVYYDNTVIDKKGNETQKVHTFDKDWSKWLIKGEKVY